jgi:hypothetical protein
MSCSVDELLKIDGPSEIAMRTLHGDEPRVIEGFVAKAECPFLGETKFTLAQLRMKLVRLTSCFRFVKAADELRGLRFSIHRSSSLPYGRLRISRPLPRSRSATCSACKNTIHIASSDGRRVDAPVPAWSPGVAIPDVASSVVAARPEFDGFGLVGHFASDSIFGVTSAAGAHFSG